MSFAIHGVGVSRGIAIGRIHVIERDQLDIREYPIEQSLIGQEIQRFQRALTVARQQLRAVRASIPEETSHEIAGFIDTHLLMLDDSALAREPERLIRQLGRNAEWALKVQRDALVAVFDEMEDSYLRTRKDDVDHVVNRIQRVLLNQTPMKHEEPTEHLSGYIIIAEDLSPADTVLMEHHGVAAFATEYGGPTSHTAILARSLQIPGIVGLHHARRYVKEEDVAIVDGSKGVLIVDPDERTLDHYQALKRAELAYIESLDSLRDAPARSADGVTVSLLANVELATDVEAALRVNAAGIGLYRSEYLYMNRSDMPSEQEQFEHYRKVVAALEGKPVTIRTADLGADKQVDGGRPDGPVAANPALGLRGVRLWLRESKLFREQLRAIFRASAFGKVQVMIPMLSNLTETKQVLEIVAQVREELSSEGHEFDQDMQIGGMIEVPAAAVCADFFAQHLDFLSIGTNDLIQYAVAIDRVNEEVNYLYDPLNPGVLRLIHMTIQAGVNSGIPVAMCGEMAGEPQFVALLLALGLREFSVHPTVLLEVKRIIAMSDCGKLTAIADELLSCESGSQVMSELDKLNPTTH